MPLITLNSVAIYPSDAPKTKNKVGALQTTANGGRTWIQRVTGGGAAIYKSEWNLTWEGVSETIRAQVEALHDITVSMPYVDQHGTSYTVICADGSYDDSVSAISPDGTLHYDVSLKILEV
jgi:hypothetical protein